ncbi:MAG: hypothetical protein ACMUIM_00640 [bacterium]
MSRSMKGLTVCLCVSVFLSLICPIATAQISNGFPPLWDYCSFRTEVYPPYQSSQFEWSNGDIIVDNFEYWDSPKNHGWEGEFWIGPQTWCDSF